MVDQFFLLASQCPTGYQTPFSSHEIVFCIYSKLFYCDGPPMILNSKDCSVIYTRNFILFCWQFIILRRKSNKIQRKSVIHRWRQMLVASMEKEIGGRILELRS